MATHIEDSKYGVLESVLILVSFLIAGFIGLFSETALNMALNFLMIEFDVVSSTVQWLTTAYLLTLGILIPVSALLIQWFSTRKLFIVSVLFSIIGAIVAASASEFAVLLSGRIIQAIGSGILIPLMFNTILLIFPIHKRGTIMGIIGLVMVVAPATAPTISGLIIERLSWNWIFWLTLPFLALALIFGARYMKNVSILTKPAIDLLSIILSTIGFGGIVYGFSIAGENGWGSSIVMTTIGVGIVSLIVFSIRQLRMNAPMLELRTFKYPMFTLGLLSVFITFMIILSSTILLPLYLQTGRGLTALTAGLVLLPGGALNAVMSPVTGRLFDLYGPRKLVIPGFILMLVTLIYLIRVTTDSSLGTIILLHTFLFVGVSLVMMPAQVNGLNQLPKKLYPHGTALLNTLQQVSGAIGTSVAITIMSASQNTYLDKLRGPIDDKAISESLTVGVQQAFTFVLVLASVGLILSFFIKNSREVYQND